MGKLGNAATEAPTKYLRNLITKRLSLFAAQNAKTIISSLIILAGLGERISLESNQLVNTISVIWKERQILKKF